MLTIHTVCVVEMTNTTDLHKNAPTVHTFPAGDRGNAEARDLFVRLLRENHFAGDVGDVLDDGYWWDADYYVAIVDSSTLPVKEG